MFYPKTKEFTIEDECVLDIKFEAKSGLIITGNVVPPTEGVNIKIKEKISGKEVANVTTDAKG